MKTYEVVKIYRDAQTGTGHFTVGERVRYGAERGKDLVDKGHLRPVASPKAKATKAKATKETAPSEDGGE